MAAKRASRRSRIRDMLGLSDRGEIIALFERVMKGEIAEALEIVRALHQAGADPADILDRARRVLPFRHPRQDRAGGDRTIRR